MVRTGLGGRPYFYFSHVTSIKTLNAICNPFYGNKSLNLGRHVEFQKFKVTV